MWVPREWGAVVALIGQAGETPVLDFKQEISSKPRDIAKDIAAMTVDGGVLIYGIAEEKATAVAARIVPCALAGREEHLRQVAAAHISPIPSLEVYYVRERADDPEGVVVVVIPPSSVGPHMVDGHYPRRIGTTNGRMSEPEVARGYERRRALTAVASQPEALFDDVPHLPHIAGMRDMSEYPGFGQLVLSVRPADPEGAHPATPWLGDALGDATHTATLHS